MSKMQTRSNPIDTMERLFYPETVIKFIKEILQIDDSVEDLCNKFNDKIVISDINCPAYINSKNPHVCNKKSDFKNTHGLCNYHHTRFMQDGMMLIGKQKNTYIKILHENPGKDEGKAKTCRHPKCKTEIEEGEYCAKHSDGNKILCNRLLKNGNNCKRFKTKNSEGKRQEYCKIHL
jgi:hypothetical protein